MDSQIFAGSIQLFISLQMFVLGPHLILGVWAYYPKLPVVANSNAATTMTSLAFQKQVHVTTGSSI